MRATGIDRLSGTSPKVISARKERLLQRLFSNNDRRPRTTEDSNAMVRIANEAEFAIEPSLSPRVDPVMAGVEWARIIPRLLYA
jgi:hypothetical protein